MLQARKMQLLRLLDEMGGTLDELLAAGLTAASKATIERLDVTFKEASRMQLLRLGGTLRIANEEVSRYTAGAPQFSARRLAFFLGRAAAMAASARRAIDADDDAAFDRLMAVPQAQPVEQLRAVVLGLSKRVVPGAFAAFDFRLRAIEPSGGSGGGAGAGGRPVAAGDALSWSSVFPMPKGRDLPAEAFLHLPQKQKFRPSILLEKKVVQFDKLAVQPAPSAAGGGGVGGAARILLGDASTVQAGDAFTDWAPFWHWDIKQAEARLAAYRPTPLDLEIELQEEVFLHDWQAGEQRTTEEGYDLLPIQTPLLTFEARIDRGPAGTALQAAITKFAKAKKRPPLYGLAHYESCKLILQPLAMLEKDGPTYITVSPDKISQAELVKAMKFT